MDTNQNFLTLGIDIGSTTAKVALMDGGDEIIYRQYERHYSKVCKKSIEIVEGLRELIASRKLLKSKFFV